MKKGLAAVAGLLLVVMVAGITSAYTVSGILENKINDERVSRGKPRFTIKSSLEECAGFQADWSYKHQSTEEGHLGTACPGWDGEVSAGALNADQALYEWLISPAHKAIILSTTSTRIGCARVPDWHQPSDYYWFVCVTS